MPEFCKNCMTIFLKESTCNVPNAHWMFFKDIILCLVFVIDFFKAGRSLDLRWDLGSGRNSSYNYRLHLILIFLSTNYIFNFTFWTLGFLLQK